MFTSAVVPDGLVENHLGTQKVVDYNEKISQSNAQMNCLKEAGLISDV